MSKRASVDEIQNAIDDFVSGLPAQEKERFNKVYAVLKDLSLDGNGNIKPTIENLKLINKVQSQLSGIVDTDKYQNKVADLQDALNRVNKVQTAYFLKTFSDFTKPKTVDKLQDLTFDSLIDQLTEAGVNENVINKASSIVEDHIKDGSSFYSLVDKLKTEMIGDETVEPRLISYAKQVINDTLSTFSANYHNLVTKDLGLEWFEYIGALIDTSRPFCRALVHKHYIHKSELNKVAHGHIDGKDVSLAGLFPNTTGSNLIINRGGWNCSHQLIPVPGASIPTELRRKFEPEIKADKSELLKSKPKRK